MGYNQHIKMSQKDKVSYVDSHMHEFTYLH